MANKLFTFRLPLREPSSPSLLSVFPNPTEQIQQLTNGINYLSLVTTHPSERMWNRDFAVPPPSGIEATIYDVWILLFRSYGKCFSGSKYTG